MTIDHVLDRIRAFALQGKLTRAELARRAGLSEDALRDLYEPSWNPTAETLRQVEALVPDDFRITRRDLARRRNAGAVAAAPGHDAEPTASAAAEPSAA